jgi:hypothetical protein
MKFEHRDVAAGAHDAGQLPQRGGRIIHVAQQVGERQSVERRVVERELLGARFDQLDFLVNPRPRDGEHFAALVDAHDRAPEAAAELADDGTRAACDVEHAVRRAGIEARYEESPPPRVLSEREEPGVAVVRIRERREQGKRGSVALAEHVGHANIVAAMGLEEDIAATRAAAARHAVTGEAVVGVVPTEAGGARVYLCAFAGENGSAWLALDGKGDPVTDRSLLRDAVSIAALCELAEESAGGGDLDDLRARLAELRAAEAPEGIDEAETAVGELEQAILAPPRVASLGYLDAVGRAAGRLEEALGSTGASPFAAAMKSGLAAAEDLADEVERAYKLPLGPVTS